MISYLSNGNNISVEDDPIPITFVPKGTDPQQDGCMFHTWSTVQLVLADLLVYY